MQVEVTDRVKLTVLVDNNTYIDEYYFGEPAASYYIETEDKCILFDTGYSDIFLKNAQKKGIDLNKLTHIVLSHGHDDHTRGLTYLSEKVALSKVKLIAHPDCFCPKYSGELYIGSPYSENETKAIADYHPCEKTYHITDKLIFLGEIPRKNQFENQRPIGKYEKKGTLLDDYLLDDTALVYKADKGIFIITGCSHSGICNIISYAKEVCGDERVLGVLGGFHLLEDNEQLKQTISYLKACKIEQLYPCHCVSLLAKARMMEELPVVEVGVGMELEIGCRR